LLDQAADDVESWDRADFAFLTFLDAGYPARLRDVHQVPPVLFARGTVVDDDRGVSVVGSRDASAGGLTFAREVSARLAGADITVLSGLAAGIDTAAHTAALQMGGRTVAVIGTGIEKVHPAANRDLQDRIAREGLVISQFWPQAPPTKQSFPMRNATMSAYGYATIVVEAGEQSGARIQARVAVEHGRPVILADLVVRGTAWGQRMVGQPGVSVAATPDDALALVHRALGRERDVDELLAMARQ
jgi:DNA processing protein